MLIARPTRMKEVNIRMMLEAYTFVRVAAGDLRRRMHERLTDLIGDETGATAAEYGVLVALIAAVIIVGAGMLGGSVDTKLQGVSTMGFTLEASKRAIEDAGIPRDAISADVRRGVIRGVTMLAVVTALMLAIAWFGGDYFLLRKIRVLTDTARRLARARPRP